jgi:hypothetical protein
LDEILPNGLFAAVNRIAAIIPFDVNRTNTSGPKLPFTLLQSCCGAARQTDHSLQLQNPMMGEFTVHGQSCRSTCFQLVSSISKTHDLEPVQAKQEAC